MALSRSTRRWSLLPGIDAESNELESMNKTPRGYLCISRGVVIAVP